MGLWDSIRRLGEAGRHMVEKIDALEEEVRNASPEALARSTANLPSERVVDGGLEALEAMDLRPLDGEREDLETEIPSVVLDLDSATEDLEAPESEGVSDLVIGAPVEFGDLGDNLTETFLDERETEEMLHDLDEDTQVFEEAVDDPLVVEESSDDTQILEKSSDDTQILEDYSEDTPTREESSDDTQRFTDASVDEDEGDCFRNSLGFSDEEVVTLFRVEHYPHLPDVDDLTLYRMARIEEDILTRSVVVGHSFRDVWRRVVPSEILWEAAFWFTGVHRDPAALESLCRLETDWTDEAARQLGWAVCQE